MLMLLLIPEMVTHSKIADMNYDNYEEKVIQRLKVKLIGWPFENIISPAKLYTVGELRTLRDALRSGACCWVKLSKTELKTHLDNMASRREAGGVVGKTRKQRSDKGVKTSPRRKPGAHDESNNNEDSGDDSTDSSGPEEPVPGSSASMPNEPQAGPSKKRKSATLAGPSKKRKRAPRDREAQPSTKKKALAKKRVGKKSAKSQLPPSKELVSTTDSDGE